MAVKNPQSLHVILNYFSSAPTFMEQLYPFQKNSAASLNSCNLVSRVEAILIMFLDVKASVTRDWGMILTLNYFKIHVSIPI